MHLTVTTWNVNSVRRRLPLLERLVSEARPDLICLQETRCPDGQFPLRRLTRLGYANAALNGRNGSHGVAVLSRLPFDAVAGGEGCGRPDSRHLAVTLGERAGLRDPLTVHNFYVPAGGEEPDPARNAKFAHKLAFLDDMRTRQDLRPGRTGHAIVVGDLNVAPLEHDAWSHRQLTGAVSHTPIECEMLAAVQAAGGWFDVPRAFTPEPAKLYTWWSYRSPDWAAADRGRRLDHIWVSPAIAGRVRDMTVARQARGWPQPSDHVPVTAVIAL